MAVGTAIDAIVFEILDGDSLELQWIYDDDDDLDAVCQEVLGEIKKTTGVGSSRSKPNQRTESSPCAHALTRCYKERHIVSQSW
jgi:hypothetical protein